MSPTYNRGGGGSCWFFPARTYATVSLINPVISSANSLGCKTPPVSCTQTNMTVSRNFPFRMRFENVQLRCSLLWILQSFPRYPVAALWMSFTSSSDAPQLHQSIWNCLPAGICLEILSAWACYRMNNLKTITHSEFNFQARIPSSSTERVATKFLQILRTMRCIIG